MKRTEEGRWLLELRRLGKLLIAATSIYIGWCGAIRAIVNDDNWNGFCAIFSTWPATYLVVTFGIAKCGRMPLSRWPIQTIMLHLYSNAFLTFLTAFGAACSLIIALLLTANQFATSSAYFQTTFWFLHAFVWQVSLAIALRKAAKLHCERYNDFEMLRRPIRTQRKRASFLTSFAHPRYSRSSTKFTPVKTSENRNLKGRK